MNAWSISKSSIRAVFSEFCCQASVFLQHSELLSSADQQYWWWLIWFQVKQMFQSSNIDAAGHLDYKSLCYIITHGEEREEWSRQTSDQTCHRLSQLQIKIHRKTWVGIYWLISSTRLWSRLKYVMFVFPSRWTVITLLILIRSTC